MAMVTRANKLHSGIGGHIGYGAVVLLISVTIAYGIYEDFRKQQPETQTE